MVAYVLMTGSVEGSTTVSCGTVWYGTALRLMELRR